LRAHRQEDDVMTLHYRSVAAAAVGLWMALPLPGHPASPEWSEPAHLGVAAGLDLSTATPSVNQRIADAIAERLRQSGTLRHYDLSISFQNGTAELRGQVASQGQRDELRRLVQAVAGVESVSDRTSLADTAAVTQAQAVVPGPLVEPQPLAPKIPTTPAAPAVAAVPGQAIPAEPTPIYQVPPLPSTETNPPPLPPYAWPTYAPYNNFSRVAYPTLYPYQAWPFIGPIYPFPKVPPGWRSIKLDWYDGYWWYGKVPNPHDWWRIRYW
jgi:BON domain